MSLLGIDVGSSSCKAVAFDLDGVVLARAERPYSASRPVPGHVVIRSEVFWEAVVDVTRQVAELVREDPIEALAVSSHGETFVPVDGAGVAVGPAIMNADNRAVEQAAWWEGAFGRERLYELTGLPLHPMFAVPKIMWLRDFEPDVFGRATRFLSVADYVLLQMGVPPVTDYSLASRTMAFDISKKRWSPDLLDAAGLSVEQFGEPRPSGEVVGKLSAQVAQLLGLAPGTIVALGGHDQPCAALGSGIIAPGEASDSAGTYECLAVVSDSPCNSERALSYNLNSYCHVVPGAYITLAFFPSGVAVRWFVEQFCFEDSERAREVETSVYDVLQERVGALGSGPTGLCITPHLVGACNPYWDPRATGIVIGITPEVTRHHVYKAIFEGIACEFAINVGVLEEIAGDIACVRISGGGASSHFSVQLRADLAGKPIRTLHTREAVCQGAAILAGLAAGVYAGPREAVQRVVRTKQTFTPDASTGEAYARQRKQYDLAYQSLEAVRAA